MRRRLFHTGIQSLKTILRERTIPARPMSEPNQFRQYQIVQDAEGNNVELMRNADQVAVLAFDTVRLDFVHCHVLLQPLAQPQAFNSACETLRRNGHPLVARLVDYGVDEGNPFYITGNVDGETLRAYLARQQDIPVWLAVMVACRSLEAALAVCERGDYLADQPMECLRVLQTSPQQVMVMAADFRVIEGAAGRSAKTRLLKSNFERQGKFLKSFLQEQSGGGPTAADTLLPAVDFGELLGGCLTAMGPNMIGAVKELRNGLLRFAPEHLTGEVPTAQKPRALVAPLLASYQEVARGVVNLVRIQSQRLDMTNPYAMRGTLTRAGRQVWVEQVPPVRVCSARVGEVDRQLLKLSKKREFSGLVPVVLVNDADGITCMAEEVAEGVSLAELLRERRGLDVQETYLVLASLDSALSQIEKTGVPCRKLRLDDVYVLTGFAREDSRTAKLLVSKLNEWPAFSVTVRAHPSLAAMSCRGTDPGVLLPLPPADAPAGNTVWNAGWMAAAGRFLLGLENASGRAEPEAGGRERETVMRLLDDEIAKARDGVVSSRADFLARYARVVQHYDLVKPIGTTETEVVAAGARGNKQPPGNAKGGRRKGEPVPAVQTFAAASALTAAVDSATTLDSPNVGFAEVLFQSGGAQTPAGGAAVEADWMPGKDTRGWAPEGDVVPLWLKAAVFLSGSMVAGAVLAHLSGDAIWQKARTVMPEATPAVSGPGIPGGTPSPAPRVPSSALRVTPPDSPPVKRPSEIIEDPPASSGLSLKPPSGSGLRDLISEQGAGQGAKKPGR